MQIELSERKNPVVAKFRCLHRNENWTGLVDARLAPVMAKETRYDASGTRLPDIESPENAKFWDATPDGHFELLCGTLERFERDSDGRNGRYVRQAAPWTPELNSCYYLTLYDPSEAPPGCELWRLDDANLSGYGGATFTFRKVEGRGELRLGVQNGRGIRCLLDAFLASWFTSVMAAEAAGGGRCKGVENNVWALEIRAA